jgi:hypothetical protein
MPCRHGLGQCRVGAPLLDYEHALTYSRTKDKLRSGELLVPGDQWPIFLYQGYSYDPDDPWNGLFRSTLLVSVCRS